MKLAKNGALLRLAIAGIFIVALTLLLRSFASGTTTAADFEPGNAGPELLIEILPGETGSEIGAKLESLGVVKSSLAFFRVAVADERSGRIAPGEHSVQTRL